ncbi:hypothetical protein [Nannocystis exedens]|nr:hypothetical protein [Nannocystis exedens]
MSFRTYVPLAALLALAPASAGAGGTRSFHLGDFDDFDAGEAEGAAIEGSGKVTVGLLPARGEVKGAASVFSCVADPKDKGAAYLGTADRSGVQRIKLTTPSKAGAAEPAASKLAELPGAVVSAMTTLPGGDLLAATLPGGTIHRIDAKGKVSEFAKLQVEQIWALVPHEGRLYVGTGPKGELFSLDLNGKDPKVVLDSDEKDILAVLPVGKDVVVGTSPGAKVLQVGPASDGVLVHDFAGDEVRALALVDGGLVAAVNDFTDRGLSSVQALTKNLNRTSLVGQPAEGSLDATSGGGGAQSSADLFFVALGAKRDLARASEATWESWLHKDKQYFTGLLAGAKGSEVLVSASQQGKVYRVRGRRDVATVADLDERQATALCRLGDGAVLAATGDGAGAYRLAAAPAQKARYRTKVLDAKQPSTFGAVYLRGKGVTLRARSGPSEEPDKRWSEWKPVTLKKEGDALAGALALPTRRFVELEVTLADGGELRDVQLFYAPENLAPLVAGVDVARPEFELGDDDEPEGKLTIKWKAEARDDDDLVYEVRVRPEGTGDKEWISLSGAEPVTKKEYKWDLDSVPDGVYEAQIIASDEPSNGIARAARDEVVSAPFVVDHRRPAIDGVKVSGLSITGTASDEGGQIHDVAFSVDGGPFRAASPSDGLFDTGREGFQLTLPEPLAPGRHRVVLRARDAFGNIGSHAVIADK